jgi:hypothetical protein
MSEKTICCPKCGSEDLSDWGTDFRMCRRCHEVFVVKEDRVADEYAGYADNLEEPSRRTQGFLESMRTERERTSEEVSIEADQLVLEEVAVEADVSEGIDAAPPPGTASATEKFEEFYADLKTEQKREAEAYAASHRTQAAPQKKKKTQKAATWIVIMVVIWLVMILICSLK